MLFPRHCRHVACKEVDIKLTRENLEAHLPQHSYYRGSDFLLLHREAEWAVIALDKDSDKPREDIFHPLTGLRIVSLPGTTGFVRDPTVDVLNPTALANRAQLELNLHPELTTVVLEGEFNHLSFIHEPELLSIEVHDIVPPAPPKLLHQARRVLGYHDVGAPVQLQPHLGDLATMATQAATEEVVLPCFGGDSQGRIGGEAGAEAIEPGRQKLHREKTVHYLDRLPPGLAGMEATLIGCKRSMDIYTGHYGQGPAHFVNICPADDEYLKQKERLGPDEGHLCLAKCCQLKEGFEARGNVTYVGWGATLQDVEGALRHLVQRALKAGVAPMNQA